MIINMTNQMSGKMTGLRSINTSPLDNDFCQKMTKTNTVCSKCYSQRLEKFYGSVGKIGVDGKVRAWVENGELFSTRILKDDEIPLFRSKRVIRFHAHGELINKTHYQNFLAITKKNPEIQFALWSKRKDIIKKNPNLDNLIVIYSTPTINKLNPKLSKAFDKVFSVYNKDFVKDNKIEINCGSKSCASCLICYSDNNITHVNELLK